MVRTAQFRALISADEIILYWSDEILPKQVWLLPQSRHHAASFLLSVVTISQMAFKKQLWIRGTTCIPQKFFSVYCCVWNTMHAGTLFTFLETTYQFHECFAWVLGFLFYVIRVRVAQVGRMHQRKMNSQKHTCERKRIAYLSGTPLPRIALPYSMALLETILPWVALPWPFPSTPHVDVLYLKVQVIWVAVSVEIFRYVAPLEEDLCWNGLGKPGRINPSKAESF